MGKIEAAYQALNFILYCYSRVANDLALCYVCDVILGAIKYGVCSALKIKR